MAVRLIVRLRTSRPPNATTGYPRLDRLAPITHYGFYVLVLQMVATGYATAILAGLNRSMFQGSGDPPQGRTFAADVVWPARAKVFGFRQDG